MSQHRRVRSEIAMSRCDHVYATNIFVRNAPSVPLVIELTRRANVCVVCVLNMCAPRLVRSDSLPRRSSLDFLRAYVCSTDDLRAARNGSVLEFVVANTVRALREFIDRAEPIDERESTVITLDRPSGNLVTPTWSPSNGSRSRD